MQKLFLYVLQELCRQRMRVALCLQSIKCHLFNGKLYDGSLRFRHFGGEGNRSYFDNIFV